MTLACPGILMSIQVNKPKWEHNVTKIINIIVSTVIVIDIYFTPVFKTQI